MNQDKLNFYDAVQRAQSGDKESLLHIIDAFQPIIQRMRYQVSPQERDDLSQSIVEGLMIKILNYKLKDMPTYSEFCRQLLGNE